MKVEQTKTDDGKAKLAISLDFPEWDKLITKAVEDIAKEVKIAGFRPGSAPRELVINNVGEAKVISAAIELAVQEYYGKAVRETGIKPIAFPAISVETATLTEPLAFSAEVSVLPEVSLDDYKSIRVKKEVEPVSDEAIEAVLKDMQKKEATNEVVERPAAIGDRAEIDFEGFVDGVAFPGGASKNHPLMLGEGMFIPGFEEGVVGMSAGDEKEITVEFPKEYHATELAGKPATFKVKLHKVTAINYPELDDEFAKKHAGLPTFAELREDVKKFLEHEAMKRSDEKLREAAVLELTKKLKADVPADLIDQELNDMIHNLEHRIEDAKMTMEEYLEKAGTNEEDLRKEWRVQAEQRVKAGLALEAFREAEAITVDEAEVADEIEMLKVQYPNDVEKIDQEYAKPASRDRLRNMIASKKSVDRLAEIASA